MRDDSAMKILVADDSLVMRRLLESIIESWGYEVLSAAVPKTVAEVEAALRK